MLSLINAVFDKKLLLYSLPNPAMIRNLKEQLICKVLAEVCKDFFLIRIVSCTVTGYNSILNKLFTILVLSFLLINVTGFKYCFITEPQLKKDAVGI